MFIHLEHLFAVHVFVPVDLIFKNLFCSLHAPVNMVRGLYWFTFLIVTSLTYDVTECLQCPTSADAWERASLALQCKLPNSYHCLKDEKNVLTEQCLAKVWIEGGMCPVYSSRMSKIDVIECLTPSCPKSTYWSNSVFLFPVCFETKKETLPTTTLRSTIIEQALTTGYSTPFIYDPKNKTEGNKTYIGGPTSMKDSGEGAERGNTTIYIVVGICVALALISGISLYVVCRRRRECKSHNHDIDDLIEQKVQTKQELLVKKDGENTSSVEISLKNGKALNSSTEKSSLMSKECSEELRKPHLEDINASHHLKHTVKKDGENTSSVEISLKSKECSEESRQPHLEDTKCNASHHQTYSSGISGEGEKSAKCTCEVYVAGGPNLPRKDEQSDAPQILLLVRKNPLEEIQIDEYAKKTFGSKYLYCSTMLYYQKHKQEEQASMLLKNFDFKIAKVEEILEKLLAVVAVVETRVAFVVAMPLETWSLNREHIAKILDGDEKFIFKTAFVK